MLFSIHREVVKTFRGNTRKGNLAYFKHVADKNPALAATHQWTYAQTRASKKDGGKLKFAAEGSSSSSDDDGGSDSDNEAENIPIQLQ